MLLPPSDMTCKGISHTQAGFLLRNMRSYEAKAAELSFCQDTHSFLSGKVQYVRICETEASSSHKLPLHRVVYQARIWGMVTSSSHKLPLHRVVYQAKMA